MTHSLSKPAMYGFLVTAAVYLILVSFIEYPLTTVFKPLPIVCLILGVLQSEMHRWAKILLIFALGFSLVGDIVLTLPIKFVLELGISSFLLGHCCYIALFLNSFEFRLSHILYFLPVLILMGIIAVLMIPHLGSMLIPVMIYFCVLMLMVFSAFQVKESLVIGSGALLFMVSDLTLALNLFIYPHIDARVFIMFTYLVAQFLITWGLVSIYKDNRAHR